MERRKEIANMFRLHTSRNSGAPVMMANSMEGCFVQTEVAFRNRITYQTGPNNWAFRPCSASKSWVLQNPYPIPGVSPSIGLQVNRGRDGKYSCSVVGGDRNLDDVMYFAGPRGSVKYIAPSSSELSVCENDVMVRLASLPVDEGFNIPRAILELKDLPRTVKTVKKVSALLRGIEPQGAKRFGNLGAKANKYRRALKSWSQQPLGSLCEAYLAYVFGIVPTMSDVENMVDVAVVGEQRASVRNDSVFKAGTVVRAARTLEPRKGFQKEFSTRWSGSRRFLWEFPWVPEGGSRTIYRTFTDLTGLNATGISGESWVNAWPKEANVHIIQDIHQYVAFGRVLRDVQFDKPNPLLVGADPTSTAWELIPFSFVVDWFADIGKWLRQENKLAYARNGGFYLDPLVGVWLGHRVERVTWVPQLDAAFNVNVSIAGDPVDGGRRYVPVDVSWNAHRQVTYIRQTIERNYNRARVRDRVDFARLNTRGISDQGPFQWITGVALAVQNCQALKRLGSILFR